MNENSSSISIFSITGILLGNVSAIAGQMDKIGIRKGGKHGYFYNTQSGQPFFVNGRDTMPSFRQSLNLSVSPVPPCEIKNESRRRHGEAPCAQKRQDVQSHNI